MNEVSSLRRGGVVAGLGVAGGRINIRLVIVFLNQDMFVPRFSLGRRGASGAGRASH